jgi:hypothetical protein
LKPLFALSISAEKRFYERERSYRWVKLQSLCDVWWIYCENIQIIKVILRRDDSPFVWSHRMKKTFFICSELFQLIIENPCTRWFNWYILVLLECFYFLIRYMSDEHRHCTIGEGCGWGVGESRWRWVGEGSGCEWGCGAWVA